MSDQGFYAQAPVLTAMSFAQRLHIRFNNLRGWGRAREDATESSSRRTRRATHGCARRTSSRARGTVGPQRPDDPQSGARGSRGTDARSAPEVRHRPRVDAGQHRPDPGRRRADRGQPVGRRESRCTTSARCCGSSTGGGGDWSRCCCRWVSRASNSRRAAAFPRVSRSIRAVSSMISCLMSVRSGMSPASRPAQGQGASSYDASCLRGATELVPGVRQFHTITCSGDATVRGA